MQVNYAPKQKANVVQASFTVVDFVLVRRAQDKGHKMGFRWLRHIRVTNDVSEFLYELTKFKEDTEWVLHSLTTPGKKILL